MTEHYPSYIVDAFAKKRFTGNPAAVCLIPQIKKDEEYLKIASELNVSETAFPVPIGTSNYKTCSQFTLRWFTPTSEVPLCGHATLATSHILFNEIGNSNKELKFDTQTGILVVRRDESGNVELNLPEYDLTSIKFHHTTNPLHGIFSEFKAPSFLFDIVKCIVPTEMIIESCVYAAKPRVLVVVVDPLTTKFELEAVKVDVPKILQIPNNGFLQGIALTLRPKNALIQGFTDSYDEPFDYASRYFAPWVGINEDPATGHAQCAMGPYWSKMTGKTELYALQAFPTRGGIFRLRFHDGRVILNGPSVTVLRGEITLDEPTFY